MALKKDKIKYRGGIYQGEVNNDSIPHGKGVFTYVSGAVYNGEFFNGKMSGHGVYTYSTGDVYNGEWMYDKKNGQGIYAYANGNVYEGEWKNDNKDGHGVFKWNSGAWAGDSYDGEWKNGKRSGRGVYYFASGAIYDGEWKNGKQSGYGIHTDIKNNIFDGEWKDGNMCGHGVYKYANGDKVEGNWTNGKKEGEFVYTYSDGRKEKRKYVNNKLNKAIPDVAKITIDFMGGKYTGAVNSSNQPDGQGVCEFANGAKYVGVFKDGQWNGHGIYTNQKGEIFEGEWEDGIEFGHGLQTFTDGSKLEGCWEYGDKEGEFIYTYPDGSQEKRIYADDILKQTIPISAQTANVTSNMNVSTSADSQNIFTLPNISSGRTPAPTSAEDTAALIEALKKITKRFGTECFRRGGKAAAALNDMLPGAGYARQRRRLATAMNTGACDILLDEREADCQLRINKAMNCLLDNDMTEDAAREIIGALASLIFDQ